MRRCWPFKLNDVQPNVSDIILELKWIQQLKKLTVAVELDDDVRVVIARGGFGEIRRGRLKTLQAIKVALKSLSPRWNAQPVLHWTKVILYLLIVSV